MVGGWEGRNQGESFNSFKGLETCVSLFQPADLGCILWFRL